MKLKSSGSALVQQGMMLKDPQSQVYMFDVNGLLESARADLVDFQKPYAHKHAPTGHLVAAIEGHAWPSSYCRSICDPEARRQGLNYLLNRKVLSLF
ncbi:MAG TPA: malic enzyme-like NAD(P)-binding protein [Acidocella sp.]|nr:malic enzyme-like NAD(P)-binding protein [Acidocella sp.]